MFYNPKVISLITIILQEVSSENDPGSLFMVVGNIFRVVFNLSTSFQYTCPLSQVTGTEEGVIFHLM